MSIKEQFGRDKWKHLLYTVSHPADGYYWIRHRDKGSVAIALLLVVLFSLCFSLSRMYAGFVVRTVNPITINSFTELVGVLLLFFILCVGNWSITCLMGGEGRFKDIVIAIGYAMLPLCVTLIAATLVSHAVAENEEAFYSLVLIVGIGYAVIMMLIGVMQVHNYTIGKTLGTLLLTMIAAFIVIFLSLLVINLLMQVVSFFRSVYTELIFRQ